MDLWEETSRFLKLNLDETQGGFSSDWEVGFILLNVGKVYCILYLMVYLGCVYYMGVHTECEQGWEGSVSGPPKLFLYHYFRATHKLTNIWAVQWTWDTRILLNMT